MHKRKLLSALLLLIVAILPLNVVAHAQADSPSMPLDALTSLAARVPGDAPLFISFRTDDAYIATLSALIGQIGTRLGIPGLDAQLRSADLAWLGTVGALVIPDIGTSAEAGDNAFVFMFSIADRAAAERFILDDIGLDSASETRDGVTYFQSPFSTLVYALTDDLMMTGQQATASAMARLARGDARPTLAEQADFQAAQTALPESAYNIFGYLDLRGVLATLAPTEFLEIVPDGRNPVLRVAYSTLAQGLGVQVFGATILEERALTLDLALIGSETTLFEAVGLPAPTVLQNPPVDLALAERIPANALVYSASTNFGSILQALLDDLSRIGDPLLQDYFLPTIRLNDPLTAQALEGFRFNALRTFVELMLEGTLGLPIDAFYKLLDGQVAMGLFIVPDANTLINVESVQFYVNGDAMGSALLVNGIARLLRDFRADFDYTEGTITLPTPNSFAPLMTMMNPGGPTELYGEDTLITSANGLLIAGSRPAVEFALRPSGDSLAASTAWTFDARLFLPGAQSILFLNIPALRALVAEGTTLAALIPPSDRVNVNNVLGLFDSMALSSATQDGILTLRLSMTLAK